MGPRTTRTTTRPSTTSHRIYDASCWLRGVAWAVPILALFGHACVGEGHFQYTGSITTTAQALHSFDGASNPEGLPPIENAEIRVHWGRSDVAGKSCEALRSDSKAKIFRSGPQGEFRVEPTMVAGGCGVELPIVLCFEHPDFDGYRYETNYGNGTDPLHAERFLNVRLKPRTAASGDPESR